MAEENMFSTADMYLAALLLANEYSLVNVDRSDPKHIHFQFTTCEEDEVPLQEVVRDYTNGDAVVSASRFVEAIRKIKSLIHSG